MDPLAAIGLAGNILAFLDFGYKLVSKAKHIHESASGNSAHNEDMLFMTRQFQTVTANIRSAQPLSSLPGEASGLLALIAECNSVSSQLASLLDDVKAKVPKSKRSSFRAAIRDWRKRSEKSELELQLDRCRQQLNLELANITR
jgi:hypothetical protein